MNEDHRGESLERIALEMTSSLSLTEVLESITMGLVDDFDAAFARIWLLRPGDLCDTCIMADVCTNRDSCLHLTASAGMYNRIDGEHRRVPVGVLKIGSIAQTGESLSSNDLMGDERVPNKAWLKQAGLHSFSGHPLVFREETLGVLALFSRRQMSQDEFARIGVFANQASVAIKSAQLFEALKESQAESELILRSAGEGIYGLDRDGRTTFVNPAAARMLGWEPEDLIGKPQHDLIHHTRGDGSTYERKDCPIYAAFKDGLVHTVNDEVFWRKDGTSLPVEYTSTPIRDNDGELSGAVVTFRDITRRIEAEQGMRDALAEVEQLKDRLQEENTYLQEEIRLEHNFDNIISNSESFRTVLRSVEQVASTDSTVLILGETGTGKELIARALHTISPRKQRALVKVNCAALPANLIESELFGHERGAFTGAVSRKQGRFELAHQGTIFLDEIGDLQLDLQAKLLRVLQEGEFERLGGTQTITVDVRVIAATNRDLETASRSGDFREDLFYRLNVFPIVLPPLRERAEDIPLLVRHFVEKVGAKIGKKITAIPRSVMTSLQAYDFPGNIRELENIVERAMILTRDGTLRLDKSLELLLKGPAASGESDATLEEVERRHILAVLETTNWRIEGPKGAALRLGLNANTLRSRLQRLGLKRPERD